MITVRLTVRNSQPENGWFFRFCFGWMLEPLSGYAGSTEWYFIAMKCRGWALGEQGVTGEQR